MSSRPFFILLFGTILKMGFIIVEIFADLPGKATVVPLCLPSIATVLWGQLYRRSLESPWTLG